MGCPGTTTTTLWWRGGRVFFDLGSTDNWDRELDCMNAEKTGRPFEFPDSYIEFPSFFKVGLTLPAG